jgi:hypothetical protein
MWGGFLLFVNGEGAVRPAGKQFEPFVFQLIQHLFPGEAVRDEDHPPTSTLVVCLLMALAGAAALLYGYAFGILSPP